MTPIRPTTRLTLSAALGGFVVLGMILFGAATTILLAQRAQSSQAAAQEYAVSVRTQGAALAFARALYQDWGTLKGLAEALDPGNVEGLRAALTAVEGDGERISWAGFATIGGTVLAASDGLLEGVDVSARPWFQRALEGPYAGDVHEAVLLNTLLGGTEEEPIRFIDLAAPVIPEGGQIAGVIGFHINTDWVSAYLAETAASLDLDLFLVNQAGTVVVATDASEVSQLELPSLRAAAQGLERGLRETWPDGRQYFTTVVPSVTYGDLPNFGWRMVGRVSGETFAEIERGLMANLLTMLAASGLILALLSVVFARLFLQPVRQLAHSAERIAAGADEYPFETRRTEELERLSAALARLQGNRG